MIYTSGLLESQNLFESLLQLTKEKTLKQLNLLANPSKLSGAEFELMVFDSAVQAAVGTGFENTLVHTDDREFPDIVADDYFGIEVKATKKDDWSSIGNSVLESSRIKSVKKIYMFFGKLGGQADIIYRNYEDCLKGIAVTHYPRYQINMKLSDGESIFSKMSVDYESIRMSDNPVKAVRAYYKTQLKEGDALWWMDDDIDSSAATSPIIKNFSSLGPDQKSLIKADIFIRFPEVFSTSNKKFEKVPAYLASRYGVVTSNLRDHFTAGGRANHQHEGEQVNIPRILAEACGLSANITEALNEYSPEDLSNAWQKHVDDNKSSLNLWLSELDLNTAESDLSVPASVIFKNY